MSHAMFRAYADAVKAEIGTATTTRFIALAETTDGRFGLFHHSMLPGAGGADPHYHSKIAESFYVLTGEVRLHDGTGWRTARAGDFMHVPENAVHGFRNESDSLVEMLIIFTPAEHREGYFEGLAALLADGNRPTRGEMVALMEKYDQFEVDAPSTDHDHPHRHTHGDGPDHDHHHGPDHHHHGPGGAHSAPHHHD
ncbi:cupin domain-containing protein [Streptomyces durocortorensis]|uniref:Cupin domain-containing protein n=1 Tax=Streptomyces durocortorensis TaxID=2811104 RepID=A0ABS2I389_9ACTN|nr:cupin domain-containing protein [Streptomyces durocortorensis]MBM7057252.1 cupin domain-containing protein [Streptomyces durocortorensis]